MPFLKNIFNLLKQSIPLKFKLQVKALLYTTTLYIPALIISFFYKSNKTFDLTSKKRTTNILLIVPRLVRGGVETLTWDLINNIDQNKFRIVIICTQKKGELYNKFHRLLKNRLYDLSKNRLFSSKLYFEIIRIIDKEKIDIIHLSNNEQLYYLLPLISKNHPHLKIINWLHCDKTYFTLHYTGYKMFSKFINLTIFVNSELANLLLKKELIVKKQAIVISNGVDIKKFNPSLFSQSVSRIELSIPKNKLVVGFVGRLVSEKSPIEFIQVCRLISLANKDAFFVVAGDGYYKNAMMNLAKKTGLAEQILFLGSVDNIPKVLSCIDILLSTSISEGFGLSVAEAMAMKIPVIAYKADGISNLIKNNKHGFLVPCYKNQLMNYYCTKLFIDKSLRKRLGSGGRQQIITRYNIKNTTKKLSAVYESLI